MNLPSKPSIQTYTTPREIIGAMMPKFKRHFEITTSGTGDFPEKRLDSDIGAEARATISEIYRELRENGFYPLGFDAHGNIRWSIALKCRSYEMIEKHEPFDAPVSSMSKAQLQEKARNGFGKIG